MKCEPFPSVIFNAVLLGLGEIRRSCLLFAEPPPAPPDCSAQGKLLTAGRLEGLGSVWFWACLALTGVNADGFPELRVWGSSLVPVLGLKRGAGKEKGVSPFQEGFPAEEDGLRSWILAAPAPFALLFLGILCSSLIPILC